MAKRGRPKKINIKHQEPTIPVVPVTVSVVPIKSELEVLTEVYQFLLSHGIHSISALEVKISQLSK